MCWADSKDSRVGTAACNGMCCGGSWVVGGHEQDKCTSIGNRVVVLLDMGIQSLDTMRANGSCWRWSLLWVKIDTEEDSRHPSDGGSGGHFQVPSQNVRTGSREGQNHQPTFGRVR